MADKRDLYEVLAVERGATARQITAAFRRLAREYHPDRNPAPDAAERFKEAAEAYGILSDAVRRQLYDRFGSRTALQVSAASDDRWETESAFE